MGDWDRRSWSPGAEHSAEHDGPDAEEQLAQQRVNVARQRRAVQRKAEREAAGGVSIPEAGGAALDANVRRKMEGHLGGDLAGVRVHTSGESAKAASQLGARAFTDGHDIHFNAGQFAPGSKEGDRLLAHELTHVVQGQKSGIQRKDDEKKDASAEAGGLEVSKPEDASEVEADKLGDDVAEKEHGAEAKGEKKDEKKKKGDEAKEGEDEGKEGEGEEKADGEKKADGDKTEAKPDDKKADEKPAAISAKYFGLGRKIFRAPVTQVTDKYHVGPGAADTAAAGFQTDGKSTAENKTFESDAKDFEVKLGALAFQRAPGIGAQVIGKMKSYLATKVDTSKMDKVEEETNALMQKCIEGSKLAQDPSFAGNVKKEQIAEIMKGPEQLKALQDEIKAAKGDADKLKNLPEPPNIREQMTAFYHFATNILTKDMIEAAGSKEAHDKLVANKNVSVAAIEERLKFMAEQGQQRKAAGGKQMEGADAKGQKGWDAVGFVPGGDKKDDKKEDKGPAGGGRPVEGQWSARENRNKVEEGEGKAKTPAADPHRTQGDVAGEGTGLSDREAQMQGLSGPEDPVKWSEGARMWIINEKDEWVKTMRSLSLPLAAGPSGTSNVLMNGNSMLGAVAPVEMRTAAMGYLMPIHAHAFVEIAGGAAPYGVPYEPGKKMYHTIAPFSEAELRDSCGRPGTGKKLFPDETEEAPGTSSTTAPPAPGASSGTAPPATGAASTTAEEKKH